MLAWHIKRIREEGLLDLKGCGHVPLGQLTNFWDLVKHTEELAGTPEQWLARYECLCSDKQFRRVGLE